jgi:glycosyltransferase involved in cell wall biosynthesis
MKIAYIAAGAGGMICGNCLRDNALASALIHLGHDVQLIPTYTPIRTDEVSVSTKRVFYGGVNVFLQQKSALFRKTPWLLDRLWDIPSFLRWVSRFAVKTQPNDLGELTVSVLQGAEGRQAKELAKLIAWLRVLNPDVVHLTNSMFAGLAPAMKAELGVPVLCALQGEDYFLSNLPQPYREQAFAALKKAAPAVDCFVAPCRDHANGMAPLLGISVDRIPVVLPGINIEGFSARPGSDSDEFVIGYLARVSPEKGLHLLAEAFRIMHEKQNKALPPFRLRVAGWLGAEHQPYLAEIRARFERWGLGSRFEYLGSIDRAAKQEFLPGLSVLAVPELSRAPKGLYVLEALASGVPVVQPRIGVFPELIEATGGGLLFEPSNVEQLAACLMQLRENRALAREMGLKARRIVLRDFHHLRMAHETIAVYQQVLR